MVPNRSVPCPLCQSRGKSNNLLLRQINLSSAVYLCEDNACEYPTGYEWIEVRRSLDSLSVEIRQSSDVELDQWLEEVFENEIADNNLPPTGCETASEADNFLAEIFREIESVDHLTNQKSSNVCDGAFDLLPFQISADDVNRNEPIVNGNERIVNCKEPIVNCNKSIVNRIEPIINRNKPIMNPKEPNTSRNKPIVIHKQIVNCNGSIVNRNKPIGNLNEAIVNVNEVIDDVTTKTNVFGFNEDSCCGDVELKTSKNATTLQASVHDDGATKPNGTDKFNDFRFTSHVVRPPRRSKIKNMNLFESDATYKKY